MNFMLFQTRRKTVLVQYAHFANNLAKQKSGEVTAFPETTSDEKG